MKIPQRSPIGLQSARKLSRFLVFPALLLALFSFSALGQPAAAVVDASHLVRPMDLDGIWLVHVGDDAAYAQPGFDDAAWMPFDPRQSILNLFPPHSPSSQPAILWYRQRLRVNPADTGLALKEQTISHAFEIYVNGEKLMQAGEVSPYRPYTYQANVLARIPDRMIATGLLTVALRVHIAPNEWSGQNPGYYASNLALGQERTLENEDWLQAIGENLLYCLDVSLGVGVGIVALFLFLAQRDRYEYFWIFLIGVIRLCQFPIQALMIFHNIPVGWQLFSHLFQIASPYTNAALYFAFLNLRIGWRFRVYLILAGVLNAYSNVGDVLPAPPGLWGLAVNLPFLILLAVVLPILLTIHWRRGNREAGILLIPLILFSVFIYANYAFAIMFQIPGWSGLAQQGLNAIQRYPIGPIIVSLNNVSNILSTITLAVILVLRSGIMSRRQALLEGELEAAREVQQVILPEQQEAVAGFAVESAYAPAQQVGGDFFQVMPTDEGGLLLVLGDVAGKGLPAAMLVSVLVGATRTAASYSHAPDEVLAQLNERLIGRSRGSFSTALAAHISADGLVTIANAGHLNPYLDGREIELPGALPLGIVSNAIYATTQLDLVPGSRLTFYSDGVIEAQNAEGELFGFERGQQISTRPASAIVESAQRFGQSDDITVVAITWSAAAAREAA